MLCCIMLYYIVVYCIIIYCSILYYIVLFCSIFYFIVLYCIILFQISTYGKLVVWIPKGSPENESGIGILRGNPRIPHHRAPNHQFTLVESITPQKMNKCPLVFQQSFFLGGRALKWMFPKIGMGPKMDGL